MFSIRSAGFFPGVIVAVVVALTVVWPMPSVLAQPASSGMQSKTQLLVETQKRLDSPDPTVRYPAYEAALSSSDPALRNLALSKGFASRDPAVRSMCLASVFGRLKTVSVQLSPDAAIAKELEAAKQQEGQQRLSKEAQQTAYFATMFGTVITVNVLAYDKDAQSFIGVVPDHVEFDRVKSKDYSVGSLSGEVLQLSAKLQRPGWDYRSTGGRVNCTMSLTLGQSGVMSGPAACSGQEAVFPRGTGRLKVY